MQGVGDEIIHYSPWGCKMACGAGCVVAALGRDIQSHTEFCPWQANWEDVSRSLNWGSWYIRRRRKSEDTPDFLIYMWSRSAGPQSAGGLSVDQLFPHYSSGSCHQQLGAALCSGGKCSPWSDHMAPPLTSCPSWAAPNPAKLQLLPTWDGDNDGALQSLFLAPSTYAIAVSSLCLSSSEIPSRRFLPGVWGSDCYNSGSHPYLH